MSPRKKEQNDELRDKRRAQIFDAALSVYIECGYNGADMGEVAEKAGLAKGLAYYYFKSKQELFKAMFEWAVDSLMAVNERLLAANPDGDPVERLVRYLLAVLGLGTADLRLLRFSMRLPFDAYAVFAPEEWSDGLAKSRRHVAGIAAMILDIRKAGRIPPVDPGRAAISFWAVFMANSLDMVRMTGAKRSAGQADSDEAKADMAARTRELLGFCFRMLGLEDDGWTGYAKEAMG
jgi:TetR/AcrR family transcriptional regulator